MNRQRGLWVGIFVLGILAGCSNKDKTLNVEGAYSPVIVNLASNHEPPVRGAVNALTAVINNPRGFPVQYQWSTTAGTLSASTSATVDWTPPNVIGDYPVTVAISAHDDLNDVDFHKTRTFVIHVDNEFNRWTRTPSVQFDVVAPTAGRIYFSQIRNPSTNESDIWSLDTPLGSPTQVTSTFWQATSPTVQSDGSRVVFLGKFNIGTTAPSLYVVPPTGGDTTTAAVVIQAAPSTNTRIRGPRFRPTGSMLAYSTDTLAPNNLFPKPWIRDMATPAQPIPILPSTNGFSAENNKSYVNASWIGSGDFIVFESYGNYALPNQVPRGLYKFSATGNPPNNPEPFNVWLNDLLAREPDWSPDGQHIVFSKISPGQTDRDLWIINANATDPAAAVRITSGPADDSHPRFSSDGNTIFFISDRADGYGANGTFETERRGVNIWSVSKFDLP